MSHKKAGGSTALGRDSVSKRLGVKLYAGQIAKVGSIIVRQRGSKFRAGRNVRKGGDDTLFATAAGTVQFSKRTIVTFTGARKLAKFVSVVAQS